MNNKYDSFKRAIKYIKPYLPVAILTLIASVITSAASAAPAWLVKYVVDNVLIEKDFKMLIAVSIAIIVIYIVKGISSYWREYSSEYVAGKIVYDIRSEVYLHLQKLSLKFYGKVDTGELISRFSNDSAKFQGVIITGFSASVKIFTILILLVTIFYKNWELAIFALIFIPVLSTAVRRFSKKLYKTGSEIQKKVGTITSFLQESISGIRVIKAFGTEEYEAERFNKENQENFNANMKNRKVQAKVSPVIDLFNAVTVVIILWFGGMQVIKGEISSGDFFTFLTALALIYDPLRTLTSHLNNISTNMSAVERIFDIIDTKAEIVDSPNATEIEEVNGVVEFKNVSFSYSETGNKVLKNINLKVNPGEVVALVGKSGSGKTTLVNLVPRFYDAVEGNILIDGKNIKDVTQKSLRKSMAIVPQETFLFGDTIYENIKYGSQDADVKDIIKAAEMANALEFIENLPDKINTDVGERGALLSGGQKQRIAIARALLKNPKILILDEATSALDTESERLVQEALDRLMKNRTTFVIAHRLSTIINADKILVMEEGEVKEAGTHEELIKMNGIYKKLYDIQFGEDD